MPISAERPPRLRFAVPLYQRVFVELRNRFLRGQYAPDEPVSSERQLMREFGISRVTARRTLQKLAGEGFVALSRGRAPRALASSRTLGLRAHVECIADMDLHADRDLTSSVLRFEHLAAPAAVAERLDLAAGSRILLAERLRSRAGAPACLWTTWIAPPLANQLEERDLLGGPLIDILEAQGIAVERVDQEIGGAACNAREAELLKLPPGHPVIRFTRACFGASGRPLLLGEGRYVPELFSYALSLIRMTRLGD